MKKTKKTTEKHSKQNSKLFQYKYLVVFTFAFALYANTIRNQYNLDDELVTTIQPENPHRLTSKGITAIPQIFSETYYKDDQGYAYDYRPVVLASFAIERSLFNGNVHISHLINAAIYAVTCSLLLMVLLKVFAAYSFELLLLITLIYAAHPLHTETVASLKNRDEIFVLLWGLLSLYYLQKVTALNLKHALHFCVAIVFLVLSICSKQSALTLIVIIPLLYLAYSKKVLVAALYTLAGILLYIPFFGFNSVMQNMYLMLAVVGAVILLYLILYGLPRIATGSLSLFYSKSFNRETNQTFYIPFELKLSGLIITLIISVTVFAGLYLARNPFAFTALTPLLFLPFVSHQKLRQWVALGTIILATIIPLVYVQKDLMIVCTIYIALMSTFFVAPYKFLMYLPPVLFAIIFGKPGDYISFMGVAMLSQFVFTNFSIRIKPILQLLAVVAIAFPAVSAVANFQQFLVKYVYQLGLLSTWWIVFLCWGGNLRKYIWILVVPSIAIVLSYNERVPLASRNYIDYVVTQPVPKVIAETKVDRPLSFLETIVDFQSPLNEKAAIGAQVLRKYLKLSMLPYPLSFYYGYKVIDKQSLYSLTNIITICFHLLLLFLATFLLRKNVLAGVGIFVYLIGIGIYAGFPLPPPGIMADRFLFVPSLGFCIVIGCFLFAIFKIALKSEDYFRWAILPKGFKYSLFAVLLIYSTLTVARNTQWKNHLTLFAADISHLQESAQANNLYALQLMKYSFKESDIAKQRQMQELAENHFKQALNVYPAFVNAQYDLARTQSILGKAKEAEASFYKAAKLNPNYPSTWLSAAEYAMQDKRIADAKRYLTEGITHNKLNSDFYLRLSLVYYLEKKFDSANIISKNAMTIFPADANFTANIGQTFFAMNNRDSALYYLRKSLQINPADEAVQRKIQELQYIR